MELRDYIREHADSIWGHKPVSSSLNVNNAIALYSLNHLEDFFDILDNSDSSFIINDIGKYYQAHNWYISSLERVFKHISRARRYDNLRYVKKYSDKQKKIAKEYLNNRNFIDIDYISLISYSKILLDRTTALSSRFLNTNMIKTHSSFTDHRNKLKTNNQKLDQLHQEYKEYIVKNTDWFEIPLLVLRDKYFMHIPETHMRHFGYSETNNDLEMTIFMIKNKQKEIDFSNINIINFSARRLALDMNNFLKWFGKIAYKIYKYKPPTGDDS